MRYMFIVYNLQVQNSCHSEKQAKTLHSIFSINNIANNLSTENTDLFLKVFRKNAHLVGLFFYKVIISN